MKLLVAIFLVLAVAAPAAAQRSDDEGKVRALIGDWYRRVATTPPDAPWALMAPGSIQGGPDFSVPLDKDSGSAAIRGPWINRELAARALKFAYDIDELVVEDRLAKAEVWERGYFYAWAAQATYENAASTVFILEKQHDGQWKILAHEARSIGIPPNRITRPMPDLRDLYYSGRPAGHDPAADGSRPPDE